METDAVLNVILQMCLTPTPTLPQSELARESASARSLLPLGEGVGMRVGGGDNQ